MNYETAMADLSGVSSALVEDSEIDGSRARRRRIIVVAAVAVLLVALAAWIMSRGSGSDSASDEIT